MPTDLLLAAFALTLLANAVLVAVSLRAMRRSRDEAAPQSANPASATARDAARPVPLAARPIGRAAMPEEIARAVRARRTILAEPPVARADAVDESRPEGAAEASARKEARPRRGETSPRRPRAPRSGVADRSRGAAKPGAEGSSAPKRGRRKFALPPLDDDHEKVSRSIETFLAGGDASSPAADPPFPATPRGAAAEPAPTTIALVAVCAPAGGAADAGTASDASTGMTPIETARAVVERTLRGAARGTDTVEIDHAGRFRIVLTGTGELAARAYLRRIRATVEPLLEASDDLLRLVTATATVLDEPIAAAVAIAERRLAAAIARSEDAAASRVDGGGDDGDDEDEPEPRAAGD